MLQGVAGATGPSGPQGPLPLVTLARSNDAQVVRDLVSIVREEEIERIADVAFASAAGRRKRVTSVDKAIVQHQPWVLAKKQDAESQAALDATTGEVVRGRIIEETPRSVTIDRGPLIDAIEASIGQWLGQTIQEYAVGGHRVAGPAQ